VAREQVPLLEEARACVARRARQQAWSEDHPLHGVLQTLQAQQTRLDALARKRLAGPWGLERLSFVEVLEQLETVLLEPVLLEALDDRHLKRFLLPCCLGAMALAWCAHEGMRQYLDPAVSLLLATLLVLVFGQLLLVLVSTWLTGRFWLTPKRLVWQPSFGQRVQVRLASIAPADITCLPGGSELQVRGEQSITLHSTFLAEPLAALLAHYRQPSVPKPPRLLEVVTYPARMLRPPGIGAQHEEHGLVVLRPGFVAFLPEPQPSSLFLLFTHLLGPGHDHLLRDLPMERLVERLRVLSDARFEECLVQAFHVRKGQCWSPTQVEPGMLHGRPPPPGGLAHRDARRPRRASGCPESPTSFRARRPAFTVGPFRLPARRNKGLIS